MRVRQPEVERYRGGLGQEAQQQQHHGDDDKGVGVLVIERGPDLGHVQRSRSGVQQRDADEHGVAGNAVGDREIDCPLDRRALFDSVGRERIGDCAHQFEEHNEVE
jgi:hypothetical protein